MPASPNRSDSAPSTAGHIRAQLEQQRLALADEIRHYPTPIAGCDQHFNTLLEEQHRVRRQLQRLDAICAEARNPADLVDRLRAFDEERLPEEAYPHDTVHTHEAAHG